MCLRVVGTYSNSLSLAERLLLLWGESNDGIKIKEWINKNRKDKSGSERRKARVLRCPDARVWA